MRMCMCSPLTPPHNELLHHLWLTLPPDTSSSPSPILTPTELIPGARFACLATQPTHALTLSVPASSGERYPAFFFSSLLPPTPKCCESLADTLKHRQGSSVLNRNWLTSLFPFGLWSMSHYCGFDLHTGKKLWKCSLRNYTGWLQADMS